MRYPALPSRALLAVAAGLIFTTGITFADDLYWYGDGTDGKISTLDNWSGASGTPGSISVEDILIYDAVIGPQETIVVDDSIVLTIAGLQVQVSPSDTSASSVQQTGGTLTILAPSGEGVTVPDNAGILLLGTQDSATASYQLTGGSLSISGGAFGEFSGTDVAMIVGHNNGSGTFTLSGTSTSLTSDSKIIVGSHGGEGTFTQTDGSVSAKGLIVGEGRISDSATPYSGSVGSYTMNGGTLSVSDARMTIGRYGTGTFVQNGGTVTATGGLYIGDNLDETAGSTIRGNGTYELKNNGTLETSGILLGWKGKGTFTHTLGSVTAGWLVVGEDSGTVDSTLYRGEGNYTMDGGTLTVSGNFLVGIKNGTGVFTQNGGTVESQGKLAIGGLDGNASTSTGSYTLKSGAQLNASKDILIGNYGGTGTLNVDGGTLTQTGGWLVIGKDAGGIGEINLTSGSFTTSSSTNLGEGNGAKGTINITGGTFTHTGSEFVIGKSTNGVGILNITGGSFSTTGTTKLATKEARDGNDALLASTITVAGSTTTAAFEKVEIARESDGSKGSHGIFTAKDGSNTTISGDMLIGFDKKSIGEFHVQSGATVNAQAQVILGYWDSAQGTLNVSDGTFTVGSKLTMGDRASAQGTINLSSGTITISKSDALGTSATRLGSSGGIGIVNQTGGTFNSLNSDVIVYASNDSRGHGTWNLSGPGQANIRRLIIGEFGADDAGASTFNLGNGSTGGTLTVGQIHSASNANSSFIFNGGKLVAATNATEIDDGDFLSANLKNLIVQNGGGTVDTNGKDISFGRALTGTGNLTKQGAGTLTLSGDHSDYTGRINVTQGNIAFAAGAKILFNVDSTNAAADNAFAFANGTSVILDDSVILQIVLSDASGLSLGQTIDLFKGSSVNIANAEQIQILINNSAYGFSLNSQGQLMVTAVPEPSTYALLAAAGLLGLVAIRRRK